MKRILTAAIMIAFMYACGNQNGTPASTSAAGEKKETNSNPSYDPNRGEGKFKAVVVSGKLDAAMAEKIR